MERHPEDEQYHKHRADHVDDSAVLNGREFFVGDRNRSGQPDPCPIFACEIEILGRLSDGIGRLLARFQGIVVQDRPELDEGASVGVRQRFVADQLAPGERCGSRVQHLLEGLGDQVEGPFGAVELDLPALDAGEAGFQRAGQSAYAGIAGHDFDQGRCGFELPNEPPDVGHRKKQQPVLFKEFAGTQRANRHEILGVPEQFLFKRLGRNVGQLRGRSIHHGEDRSVPIECVLELIVALAPIKFLRNQRVDVGVDCEVMGGVEARPYRKDKADQENEKGKPRASLDNRYDNTCQHSFSFWRYGLASNARYLPEFREPI